MVYRDKDQLREYNRARAERLYEEYVQRRDVVMESLGGECYLCVKPAAKNFHLHHMMYHETESDYPRSGRSLYIRLKRVAEAEKSPERFRLLCAPCHRRVEALRAGFSGVSVDLQRLAELVLV